MHTREQTDALSGAETGARASGVLDEARSAAERAVHEARERVTEAAGEIRREASDAGGTISSIAIEQAERRKDDAADGLRAFASAVRRASDELGAQDQSMAARVVQEAARGLERLSGELESRSVADMARSVTTFGRENPATFLTGCLLAGVAVGRFLVASSGRDHDDYGSGHSRYAGTAGERYSAGSGGWRADEGHSSADEGWRSGENRWPGDGPQGGDMWRPEARSGAGAGSTGSSGSVGAGLGSGAGSGVGAGVSGGADLEPGQTWAPQPDTSFGRPGADQLSPVADIPGEDALGSLRDETAGRAPGQSGSGDWTGGPASGVPGNAGVATAGGMGLGGPGLGGTTTGGTATSGGSGSMGGAGGGMTGQTDTTGQTGVLEGGVLGSEGRDPGDLDSLGTIADEDDDDLDALTGQDADDTSDSASDSTGGGTSGKGAGGTTGGRRGK